MDNFSQCFAFTLGAEGGYSNNSSDPGNWTGGAVGVGDLLGTKFGISAASYPQLDIAGLTEQQAQAIYRRDYWSVLQGDELPLPVALVAFDSAVNAGVRRAVIWLQQASGVAADGVIGSATMAAVKNRDAAAIAREALALRLDFTSRLPAWLNFSLGWSRRIVALAGMIS